MERPIYIAAISSYGTVSFPEKRYRAAIRFSNKEELLKSLESFIRSQVLLAHIVPEFKEDLEDSVNIEEAFDQIEKQLNFLSDQYFDMMSSKEREKRFVVEILEILTDFHLEILAPDQKDKEWIKKAEEIGILATYGVEGCAGEGEFLEVQQICIPSALVNPETEENADCIDMTIVEKWNHLVDEGSVVPVIS